MLAGPRVKGTRCKVAAGRRYCNGSGLYNGGEGDEVICGLYNGSATVSQLPDARTAGGDLEQRQFALMGGKRVVDSGSGGGRAAVSRSNELVAALHTYLL